jgi:hypothetical protein
VNSGVGQVLDQKKHNATIGMLMLQVADLMTSMAAQIKALDQRMAELEARCPADGR